MVRQRHQELTMHHVRFQIISIICIRFYLEIKNHRNTWFFFEVSTIERLHYYKVCDSVCVNTLRCQEQWIKQPVRIFGPELIRMNAASPAKFSKRDITSALGNISWVFWPFFWLVNSLPKEVLYYTRIHSLHVNHVVAASSHALWCVLSNKVIWVFGPNTVELTPHS